MGKISIDGTYSTIYTDPDKQDCLQTSVTVKGQAGKQITLEGLGLDLQVTKAGIAGIAWVTANGTKVAEWTGDKKDYQSKTASQNLTFKDGEKLVLKIYIKTLDAGSRARMTNLTYTYSLADVPKSDESSSAVLIKGITKTQADELVTKLKTDYPGIEAYTNV